MNGNRIFPSQSFVIKKKREHKKEHFVTIALFSNLCRKLKATTNNTAELLDTNVLALNLGAGLVLLVSRNTDNSTINLPSADVNDELIKRITAANIEPGLEVLGSDGAEGLSDLDSDANAHELLETGDVGGQVGVEIVRVQGGPELGVLGGLEEGGEAGELLDGLDEVGLLGGGLRGGGVGEGLGAWWEQGEAEREGGGGEHGQGLGEDVGDGVGLEEVGVELEAGELVSWGSGDCEGCLRCTGDVAMPSFSCNGMVWSLVWYLRECPDNIKIRSIEGIIMKILSGHSRRAML